MTAETMPADAATMTGRARRQPSRAYAPHRPTWQRFHEHAAPLASSSGAVGSVAAANSAGRQHPYARQYSHVYSARLAALRERCLANARESLSKEIEEEGGADVAGRIIEVKEGAWSILVGTIVKEVDPKRRPKVAQSSSDRAIADARSFLFPTAASDKVDRRQESLRSHLFDPEKGDVLHLEDESGRVELAPEGDDVAGGVATPDALDPNAMVTGAVAAVVGKVCAAKGIARVRSVHFAGPPPSDGASPGEAELRGPSLGDEATNDEPVLLLVSGLGCGSDSPADGETGASLALRREMLLEYLTDPDDATDGGASVCRVVVAGGGVSAPSPAKEEEPDKENVANGGGRSYDSIARSDKSRRASSSRDAAEHVASSLRDLDAYLAEMLGGGIPVDYVPGLSDPTNANWPQRPMHSCLLPLSCGFVDLFGRGTNPYEGVLGGGDGGVRVLGTDGLNVADLRRFLATRAPTKRDEEEDTNGDDRVPAASCLDALNQTLRYGHVAPTGPDSLPIFPSSESDPFVMERRPSVYFAGNCDRFDTRLVDANGGEIAEGGGGAAGRNDVTRLVCVPSFAVTGEVVLVKLQSLECRVVSFNDASL
eukprot:CAMPEP_0172545222 /NCGR_PEP_ID=MMETSP1067-20121228/15189_1 /TAXON_ID=265564 ORGANISM="Thalassiosira punctigera, Strain Tpunct2005C2" /NCGR_SAMPLE_ID=MMETSP1067 /ASSEMBLY_ACC=CAM_ASM_000444 /LENGTH=596 /DNA_ID=CAMNT_0013331925 /DNA_START=32 /DNA_END=1822 /DNA_ORIENTATION=-